jgi:hypothetical protein
MQFDTTINKWHTSKATGRINASNPCSEYMFLDNTACNLASLNLVKFLREDGTFNIPAYKAAVRTFIIAQDILVDKPGYPSELIALNSHDFRSPGLGYANLGALLLNMGLAYDSEEGRNVAAALTAILGGMAYKTSAELAAALTPISPAGSFAKATKHGEFPGFADNEDDFRDVMRLTVPHPRLWWPNGYGDPALHTLKVAIVLGDIESAERQIDFGMRELSYETSLLDASGHLRRVEVLPSRTHDEALPLINESHDGIRQIDDQTPNQIPGPIPEWFRHAWVQSLEPVAEGSPSIKSVEGGWPGTDLVIKVNGVRIAARGGNWGMDDSRKRVSIEHLEPFFRLHRDAHVNMIRDWMGQDSEENFYALADKYGLMVWNDFWESTQGYNLEAQDPRLWLANAKDTILRFRHHPSIVIWCGRNEGVPQPILNEGLAALTRTLDHTRYYTGSSNQVNLRNSGPYQHQTPDTFYRINRGFSVELGIPSVPTLESIESFISGLDRWPISDTWAYHDWHQSGNGAVGPFMAHMETQFGAATSLEDFERKAQMLDYVGHRAIFEGFAAHLWQPNSGRMIWMTQPAWSSMEWNFLSPDYDTQSSFYGTQKACEPVHAQLDLTNGSVDLINLGDAQRFKVSVRVVSLEGKTLDESNPTRTRSLGTLTPRVKSAAKT